MKNTRKNLPGDISIDNIDDTAILFLDENGNIKKWNKGAERMKGYCSDEVIGRSFNMFFTKEDRDNLVPEQLLAQAKATGSATFSGWRVRKDGTIFWVNSVFTTIYDDKKNIIGFTKVVHDHTAFKKQIEFERSNLNALINNLSGVMWSVSTNYTLITANHAFDAMVAFMSGNKIEKGGDVFGAGFTAQQVTKFKSCYDRAFAGETFSVIDYMDEPFERWSEISFSPIRQGYTVIGAACYSHDITQSKLIETRLVQANRLYTFTSQVNEAIIHAEDDLSLFQQVCSIAVTLSKFKVAWIGLIDTQKRKINLVAQHGFTPEIAEVFSNTDYQMNGPIDQLLTTGSYYVCNHIEKDLELDHWKPFASTNNFRSIISLPIKRSGEIIGALSIYASEVNYFNSEEIELLNYAANEISFALDVFEKERLRMHAEEMLKRSEHRFRSLIENSADALAIFSAEGKPVYVSKSVEGVLGYTYTEALNFEPASIVHPDNLPDMPKILEKVLANPGIPVNGIIKQMKHKNGSWRWIESTMTNMLHDPSINGIVDNFRDITERKLAEEKLKHNETRFKQAQEIAHFGNWEFDFATGVVLWSEEACRIYGLPTNDNKHTFEDWISFIHPDDREYVLKVHKDILRSHSNAGFYHRIIRQDDRTIRHVHSLAHFDFDRAGKPIGIYGTAHDVTKSKEAEEKLKAINIRLNKAQEIANYGGYEVNFSTGKAVWSDQFCKIYGLSPEDNVHDYDSWLSFVHPDDHDKVKKIIEEATETHSNVNFYYRIVRRDGTVRCIHSYRQIEFDNAAKPVGAYAVAHDITEDIGHVMQLKAQNEQLRQIAWIQSHKVRAPLAAILGLAQLFKNKDTNQTREIIEGILESSEKLDTVIREIVSKTSVCEINDTHHT